MGGRGSESRGKGVAPLKGHPSERGRRRSGGGEKREVRLEKAFSHLRRDPFWREKAENWEAAEAGRGCSFAGPLAREEARPRSCRAGATGNREGAGTWTARGRQAAAAVTSSLPSRPTPPPAAGAGLTDEPQRETQ